VLRRVPGSRPSSSASSASFLPRTQHADCCVCLCVSKFPLSVAHRAPPQPCRCRVRLLFYALGGDRVTDVSLRAQKLVYRVKGTEACNREGRPGEEGEIIGCECSLTVRTPLWRSLAASSIMPMGTTMHGGVESLCVALAKRCAPLPSPTPHTLTHNCADRGVGPNVHAGL
jgi:hypothetical protein